MSPEISQKRLETVGCRDPAERPHPAPPEDIEIPSQAPVDFLQVLGPVGAFDDVDRRVMPPDQGLQVWIRFPVGFGQEDIGGPLQVFDGLAHDPPRQQTAVAERIGLVDEEQVEPALQRQVLEPVIEDEGVTTKVLDRVRSAFHPVLVDQHDHPGQVFREHVGFVSRLVTVQKHRLAVAHNARRRRLAPGHDRPPESPMERLRPALVAAAEDGHFPSPFGQGSRELLHHRGLAGSAHGQVPDHDDEAPEVLIVQDPLPVEPESQLDYAAEQQGIGMEKALVNRRPGAAPTFEDDVDRVLLEQLQALSKSAQEHSLLANSSS